MVWRFTDAEKYCQLTHEEWRRFVPLSEEESLAQWTRIVHSISDRPSPRMFDLAVRARIRDPEIPKFCSVNEAEVGANLQRYLPADASAEALFFWDMSEAVRTDYGLFLMHWDDFCYPSDDCNVLVLPELSRAVMYSEEYWYVLEITRGQTLFPVHTP